jgi:hypothetical protein
MLFDAPPHTHQSHLKPWTRVYSADVAANVAVASRTWLWSACHVGELIATFADTATFVVNKSPSRLSRVDELESRLKSIDL